MQIRGTIQTIQCITGLADAVRGSTQCEFGGFIIMKCQQTGQTAMQRHEASVRE